jgi:hypothetical protein
MSGGSVHEADSLRSELDMAKQCGQYINSAVESWLSDKSAPISPTMPEILAVVAKAVSSMPLPNREDLLNFQNFVEADVEAKIFRFLTSPHPILHFLKITALFSSRDTLTDLLDEYNRCIQVLPSNAGPSS